MKKEKKVAVCEQQEKTKVQLTVDSLIQNSDKDGLKKLRNLEHSAKQECDREYARLMRENAEFYYYMPQNDREWSELLSVRMIRFRENRLEKLIERIRAVNYNMQEHAFDKKVHARVLKSANKEEKENWKYNYMDDIAIWEQGRLEKFENETAYNSKWIEESKKLIKTKRYHELPDDYFINNKFDFQLVSGWEDEFDDCSECNCCC
ncbi:hypothetical protein HN958_04855 [Candidatus Falkowbacteria bacterium]|jgi:hypothetical protein|nr:hypothetical protein [Candidatus Falkowbacteria bacterium]MBT7007800.1 hypothetical protein [Candidatus Falkowbacteria bacterium]